MQSSGFLQFLNAPRMLLRSSLSQISGREFSLWNVTRAPSGFSNIVQCCNCNLINSYKKTAFKQINSPKNVPGTRNMSSRKANSSRPEPAFFDPDVGDLIEDPPPPKNKGILESESKKRVSVKFNWKNALVTTDSVKLLENLYQSHPQLVEFDENELVDCLQIMSVYSLDVEKAAKMIIMNPRLLKMSDETIGNCVTALRTIGLSESQRGHILRSIPEIFNFPSKLVINKFTFLKTYFTKDETVDVLCKSADVFFESEASLKPKLEYLIKNMSHETKSIVSCKALSYSLRHIKTRHEFLIRCGLIKPIPYRKLIKVLEKDYKDKSKPRDKYFKPMEIVCFNDQDFLKACTKSMLTLNELVAFEELFGAELDVSEDASEGDEDDDAEEEEDDDDDDESSYADAVSLVKTPNSIGFFNDVEAKSCYF